MVVVLAGGVLVVLDRVLALLGCLVRSFNSKSVNERMKRKQNKTNSPKRIANESMCERWFLRGGENITSKGSSFFD